MKIIKKTYSAGEVGNWIPVNRNMASEIGFTVHPHTSSGGTYDVNFTTSDLAEKVRCDYSRTTTTLTITLTAHGLTTADAVVISGNSDFEGQYNVASVTDADNITVTVADSGGTSGKLTVTPLIVDIVTDFDNASGTSSGNIFASISALRLDAGSVITAGIDFEVNQW